MRFITELSPKKDKAGVFSRFFSWIRNTFTDEDTTTVMARIETAQKIFVYGEQVMVLEYSYYARGRYYCGMEELMGNKFVFKKTKKTIVYCKIEYLNTAVYRSHILNHEITLSEELYKQVSDIINDAPSS